MPRQPPPERDLIERRELMDAVAVGRTLRRMALEIAEMVPSADRPLYLVGVRTGGAYLAHRLCDMLVEAGEPKPLLGAVDISLYRDDVFHGLPLQFDTKVFLTFPPTRVNDRIALSQLARAPLLSAGPAQPCVGCDPPSI